MPQQAGETIVVDTATEPEVLAVEELIEDVSIDGMCGVY